MLKWFRFLLLMCQIGSVGAAIVILAPEPEKLIAQEKPPKYRSIPAPDERDQQLGKLSQWQDSHDRSQSQLERQVRDTKSVVDRNSERIAKIETQIDGLTWWARTIAATVILQLIVAAYEIMKSIGQPRRAR
jgi:hypothetical protein